MLVRVRASIAGFPEPLWLSPPADSSANATVHVFEAAGTLTDAAVDVGAQLLLEVLVAPNRDAGLVATAWTTVPLAPKRAGVINSGAHTLAVYKLPVKPAIPELERDPLPGARLFVSVQEAGDTASVGGTTEAEPRIDVKGGWVWVCVNVGECGCGSVFVDLYLCFEACV